MASTVGFVPGTIIRWRKRCFVVVDRDGMDTIIVQEQGKGGFERIPVREAQPGHGPRTGTTQRPDLISVPEEEWQAVVRQFEILKPLLKLSRTQRTLTRVQKAADALGRHPATIYRWIEKHRSEGRVSALLRKERSDRGKSHLSETINSIIDTAINKIYLAAECPNAAAVIEEVNLQCFKAKIERPGHCTCVAGSRCFPDRLKLEKRQGRKAAAEKYEPIKGHFPGADYPLAVAQIDHTPMDVIVVDEEHRQPIQRPSLTVVIDVYSRMVLGFAIYLEKPSAFAAGLAIAHAVLPKARSGSGTKREYMLPLSIAGHYCRRRF